MTYTAYLAKHWAENPPGLAAYLRRPSVLCECGVVFSDVVACLHGDRTGHRLSLPKAERKAAA
jgi:hypothetical protein